NRNDNFVMNDETLEVRIAVVLAGAVMAIIVPVRREAFQPRINILNETILCIIDVHTRRNVHGGNKNHSLPYSALAQGRFHLGSDVDILPVFRGFKSQVFGMKLHTRHLTSMTVAAAPEFHPSAE